jgi:excinuclease ABC subunit B
VTPADPKLARSLGLGRARQAEPPPEGEIHPGNRKRDVGLSRDDILKAAPKRVRQGNVLRDEEEDEQLVRNGLNGATATVDSLKSLLEQGDPNLRQASVWSPHRPPRPEKSEGGIAFGIVSEFEPKGDQPTAIAELVSGVQGRSQFDLTKVAVHGIVCVCTYIRDSTKERGIHCARAVNRDLSVGAGPTIRGEDKARTRDRGRNAGDFVIEHFRPAL